jgi:hypothetical protein
MGINEETLRLFNAVVQTEEDEEAFEAGRSLGQDALNEATLGGAVDGSHGGVYVQLDVKESSGTWLEGRRLPRAHTSVLVEDPAFILGTITAALENKIAQSEPQT